MLLYFEHLAILKVDFNCLDLSGVMKYNKAFKKA